MPTNELWPGQVQKAYFTLDQVKALSSLVRSEVFYAFSATEPLSSGDVATATHRTAPTVRYHVNELIRVGLLIPVETRKKRSRTEEAYVQAMVDGYTPRPPFEKEYLEEMHRGFGAILRGIERERASALAVANEDAEFYNLTNFRHTFLKLTPERAAELRKKLNAVVLDFLEDQDPNAIALHAVTYMSPLPSESRKRYREVTGKDLKEQEPE